MDSKNGKQLEDGNFLDAATAANVDIFFGWEKQKELCCEADAVVGGYEGGDEVSLPTVVARFGSHIKFGTAGLRGPMTFGTNAMNSCTVLRASQGLCEYYLNQMNATTGGERWVCVGFDGRHNSEYFAHLAAAVFLSKDFRVSLSATTTATPMCPFAVQKLRAVCGVQVTASHNPANDNGYKVYGSNGAQIVPPMDQDIFACILKQQLSWPQVDEIMSHKLKRLNKAHPLMKNLHDLTWDLWPAYKSTIARSLRLACPPQNNMQIVYTAMHGVGYPFVSDMLRSIGFDMTCFHAVPTQRDPDPCFSTVAFPNPEEKGAMDAAIAHADVVGADLIISNDPDADRFACCERVKKGSSEWYQFTGDELGAIFGAIAFETALKQDIPKEMMAFICSAVSSKHLARVCDIEGCHFAETLTGFKYLMNKAFALREEGYAPIFAYEEALGYALSMSVPDKDGVSAAAAFVRKAVELNASGQTMQDYLHEQFLKYGFSVTRNSYFKCGDPSIMADIMTSFRNEGQYRDSIGAYKVSRIRDVAMNYDSGTQSKTCQFNSKEAMLTIWFENGAHVTFRGSGTEPKFKYYSGMSHSVSKAKAQAELDAMMEVVLPAIIGDRPLEHA